MAALTRSDLVNVLDYDDVTGTFVWRKTGSVAGTATLDGYRAIVLNGKSYRAHRLAWFYVHGEWPAGQLDHIDRNKKNNSIRNLRQASFPQNQGNAQKRRDNTSGFKGVSFHKQRGKWRADIRTRDRQITIGHFETKEEAHNAYAEAARAYFGEFANP